ncbi:MAG: nitroreductase [Rhodothalassiaceae bacterium]|nr:MAG: nitroreductase [Rhodothalassiaceae bacterium]
MGSADGTNGGKGRAMAEDVPAVLNLASEEGLRALLSRRSVKTRDLGEPGPQGEALARILAAARRVPDHGKLAPWRFIVVSGEARAALGERLAACRRAEEPEGDPAVAKGLEGFFLEAPVVVILVSSPSSARPIPEWEQQLSCGAAGFALLAAAHMSGFAGQWLTGWPAYSRLFAACLGLAPRERIAGFIFLGTARRTPSERPRPAEEEVVRHLATAADVAALTGAKAG